jgi:DNA-binding MarR family transcriptional regulator
MMVMSSVSTSLGERLCAVAETIVDASGSHGADRQLRRMLAVIAAAEPVALKPVAAALGRPLPAVSRSVDALVRAGLVSRTEAADDRRRLALSLTEAGRARLANPARDGDCVGSKLERLAHSELRAVERAIEILERGLA